MVVILGDGEQHHRYKKPLVDKMKKANLAAETVNKYVKYVKQSVASLKDGAAGEPIHDRKWDSALLEAAASVA
jgi:hypothetical protein